jgi:hypothetical protein
MRQNCIGTEVYTSPVNMPGIPQSALMVDLPLPVPERQRLPLKARDGCVSHHVACRALPGVHPRSDGGCCGTQQASRDKERSRALW